MHKNHVHDLGLFTFIFLILLSIFFFAFDTHLRLGSRNKIKQRFTNSHEFFEFKNILERRDNPYLEINVFKQFQRHFQRDYKQDVKHDLLWHILVVLCNDDDFSVTTLEIRWLQTYVIIIFLYEIANGTKLVYIYLRNTKRKINEWSSYSQSSFKHFNRNLCRGVDL